MKESIKKFLSVLIITALFMEVQMSHPVAASSVEVVVYEITDETASNSDIFSSASDVRNLSRSSAVPVDNWDLSSHYYRYGIYGMTECVYSDYLFDADSNGRISISTNNLNSGHSRIKISIHKWPALFNSEVASWIGDPQSIQGLGFNNLSNEYYYFFKFEAYEASSVSGYGYIHYPDVVIPNS